MGDHMPLDRQVFDSNLSSRLIFAFVIVIITTTVAAGVPAYWIIRTELEQNAWDYAADGSQVTRALLVNEQDRLANLAILTSQRPTLQKFLAEEDIFSLHDYLHTFKAGVELDILIVVDVSYKLLAEASHHISYSDALLVPDVGFHTLPGPEPQLALLACRPIHDEKTDLLLGYVITGVILNDEFARRLASVTGLTQSIILEGRRVASSVPLATSTVDVKSIEEVEISGQSKEFAVTLNETRYYTSLFPILGVDEEVVGLLEVGFPVGNLVSAEHKALLTLNISTFLVIVLGSVLGSLYAKRLSFPLRKLTVAASKISEGDLETPVPSLEGPDEIVTLAAAFEESRINTRRVLENLSRAKAWSETLIQSIAEGILTINGKGEITSFSQGAERITGWKRDDVLHRSIDEVLLLPEEEGRFLDNLPPYGGKRKISIIVQGGRRVNLAITDSQLTSLENDSTETALVLRDITEEEAIQHLRSYFLANISHEFRTPLSAINASVELLLHELEDLSTAEISELLNSIHMSVSGLQALIDNLLESISIEAGRFHIQRRPSDLNKTLVDAVRMMKPLLNRRRQHLSLDKPVQLPLVNIDPTRITQVLVNLLSNASKYSPIGKPIDLSMECVNQRLFRISVTDRGPGIPPVERADIFHRFVRLEAHNGAQYGVGLGLSVVKAIVEEHDGEVGVDDRPGGGSIFWFTLPMSGVTHESSDRR